MRDIPIIFSGPMVRALLDGRKTMTRRMAWRDAKFGLQDYASEQLEEMDARGWNVVGEGNEGLFRVYKPTPWQRVKPGDRLWVGEAFRMQQSSGWATMHEGQSMRFRTVCIDYEASKYTRDCRHFYQVREDQCGPVLLKRKGESGKDAPLNPGRHLPRQCSRLTLIVTATKIERLRDISERDALREGIYCKVEPVIGLTRNGVRIPDDKPVPLYCTGPDDNWADLTARDAFRHVWIWLHGKESWDADPKVVALTFTVHKQNIDTINQAIPKRTRSKRTGGGWKRGA